MIGALQVTDDGRYYSFGMTDLSTSSLYTVVDTTKGELLYQNQLPYGNKVYTANTNQVLYNKLWNLKDIRNLAESSL